MKKILVALMAGLLFASVAQANVWSTKVCDSVTLTQNTTTDCTTADLTDSKFFSFQVSCASAGGNISVDVDWIAGSGDSSTYLGIPVLSTGSAMSQLITTRTTETTWSTLQSIQPPVAPFGTLRFTENNIGADTICSAILNMGN